MDGPTERFLAVIGHPVAGNPSQFAIERALQASGLEWRVFSFDINAEDLPKALDGLEVLGARGVLIDPTLQAAASMWRDAREPQPWSVDCFLHDDGAFIGINALAVSVRRLIDQHLGTREGDKSLFVAGEIPLTDQWQEDMTVEPFPADVERVPNADVVLLGNVESEIDAQQLELEVDDWPKGNEQTLVIDLHGHRGASRVEMLGYKVVSAEAVRVHMLSECFFNWTGTEAPWDVIHEAIEEYLGV